jgi:hypothetical protein
MIAQKSSTRAGAAAQRKRDFAAMVPVVIAFMAGCNFAALFVAPWSRGSWLQAVQLVVWLSLVFYIVRIQRRRDANLRATLVILSNSAKTKARADDVSSSAHVGRYGQRLRPPTGPDPTLN